MVSLFITPIVFKSSGSFEKNCPLEWKKQIATVSYKKGLQIKDYVIEKYSSKIAQLFDHISKNVPLLLSFSYNNDYEFFVFGYKQKNKNITSFLHYSLHLPCEDEINFHDLKNIIKRDTYIEFNGECIGFSINKKNYYLEDIDINEYVQFCKRWDESDQDSQMTDNYDSDDNKTDDTEDEENEEDDDEEELSESDEDSILSDNELDIDTDDTTSDTSTDDSSNNDSDSDNDESDMVDTGDDDSNVDETEDAEEKNNDDDEDNINSQIDDDTYIDFEIEQETDAINKKRNIKTLTKSLKITPNTDVSIILNTIKSENIDTLTPFEHLNEKRQKIINILNKLPLSLKIIQMIEKGIYNFTIQKCHDKQSIPMWENMEFVDIYLNKAKNLYCNLNTKCYVHNLNLIDKIKKNIIQPYDLAFIDNYKLFPEKWQEIIDEKAKTEKMIKESIQETATDIFQCPRCKQRKTIYCEVQIRSSDEPMTKFITCINCGKKWKQG